MADEDTGTDNTDAGSDEGSAVTAEETTTAKNEGGADATGDTSKDGDADKDKAEESATLEDFSFPEGMEIDQVMLDQFKPIATELGLDQAGAQKLVDLYASSVEQATTGLQEQVVAQRAEWVAQGKADKEFGGDRYDESVALAVKGIEALGGDSLKEALTATGFGDHPEALKLFAAIGKIVGEDGFVLGGGAAGERSQADILFGNTG